jgi:carbonic anhydrase
VPPELLFDAAFGELFIVRAVGNVMSPEGHAVGCLYHFF